MKTIFKIWTLVAVFLLMSFATAQAPVGDYGDAPDGQQTFWAMGRFPTLYDSTSGLMGGHTLITGQEMIGTTVSDEEDADDIADPDGIQNLVDEDLDDKVYITVVAVSIPAPAKISFPITIDDSAPRGQRYINVLFDFDRNGSWGGDDYGLEWAVKNEPMDTAPGSTEWFKSDWFNWGGGMTMPSRIWGRAAITREPIDSRDWKGDGEFEFGEIQDFFITFENSPPPINITNVTRNLTNMSRTCGNNKTEAPEECDGPDDAKCPGKCRADCTCPPKKGGGGGGDPPGEPGPRKGPCTTPVSYHALVINAGDNSRRKQGQDAADDIWDVLGDQGYDRGHYLAPHWDKEVGDNADNGVTDGGYSSIAGIEAALKKMSTEVKCVDRVMIYIVGHGLKPGGSKYGKTWPSGGIILQGKKGSKEILTPEKLNELLEKYLPSCANEDCKTEKKSCHVSVVVESCHSGNFLKPLSKPGRTVAVSSSSSEVARFGVDEKGNSHSGDYTNGYVKDLRSPDTADTNKDGYVSVGEAHDSANAKLSVAKKGGSSQTPGFYSDECECLPLTCGPKCGDGVISGGEECDYTADPTGCPDNAGCNKECECEYIDTPPEDENYCGNQVVDAGEECDPTAFPTGCPSLETCVDCECVGDDIPPFSCPDNFYETYDECAYYLKEYKVCKQDASTGCWYVQSICERGEYVASDCEEDCEEGTSCVMVDESGPCYGCDVQECEAGEFETQDACESDCDGQCNLNEASNCWYCEEDQTCEDLDMYGSQNACGADCDSPDYCAFHEGYDCWYCKQVTVTCGAGLYDSSNCDGECPEQCNIYQDGPCYRCMCPDLYVKSRSTNIGLSASYQSGGELGNRMTCTRTGYVKIKIANAGPGSVGASTARVSLSPGGALASGDASVSIEALAAGASSSEKTVDLARSYTGSGTDCSTLDWWASTYTVTVTADYGNAISECDETNNQAESTVNQS